jgi:hypothetical protein
MAALRPLLPLLSLSASLAAACGGSSSETPPPLPPLALNEPYRAKSAVLPRAEPTAENGANEESSDGSRAPAPPARTTWGSNAPPPLPELSPK